MSWRVELAPLARTVLALKLSRSNRRRAELVINPTLGVLAPLVGSRGILRCSNAVLRAALSS